MNFCPKCGALLQVAKKGAALRCPKCKYQEPLKEEETKQKATLRLGKSAEIAVIDRKAASLRQLSTVKVVCPICGHTESETWTVETANETIHASVTFFRCTNCGATRRETG
ncbi:MAG: RPA12/RPB9/RPC11 RNA polymerase family protein [Candidatus Bathyarchaeota archaeon]|nr:RPA12/RPB9/RPC11 RNA polymerase family protein [Candidatus Bathyarchaeota archaeon]